MGVGVDYGRYDRLDGCPGPTIQIPRWIQLVGLPVLLVVAFLFASTLGHVLFLFLTASVIAFMLNPLVRDLSRLKVPRALSVTIVYAIFAATVAALLIAIGAVAFDQARNAAERVDEYVTNKDSGTGQTEAERDIDGLQAWLDDHGLESIQVREQVTEWIDSLGTGEISGYAQEGIAFAQGAAISVVLLLFSAILIVVISIYMLLDMPRLERSIDTRFPPHGGPPLAADRVRALGVRQGAGDPLDGDRNERGGRDVDPGQDRTRRGRRRIRAALRSLDRVHRGDPVHRPLALGRPADHLRAVRGSGGHALGRRAVPVHLPGRGTSWSRT